MKRFLQQPLWAIAMLIAHIGYAAERPNIILFLADDIGAEEIGCYGNKVNRTPNLDKLAAEGARLETFYANPLCTPTRVCLMTGQYGYRNGFLGMLNPAFVPVPGSPEGEIGRKFTNGKLMKSAGYATAQVGKWQLSGKLPERVFECGFDAYQMWAYDKDLPPGVTHPAHEPTKGAHASRYWHPCIMENGKYRPTGPDDYGPDINNQFALDFARTNKNQPFFIYYTSLLTHPPHLETPDPEHPGKRIPGSMKSNVEYMDYLIGKLVAGLKEQGQYDNTIIIFIGDNGTSGHGKGKVSELGARVPFIVHGPGIKPGLVSRALGDLSDIMPTLAEWGGGKVPADVKFDGYSMASVLAGKQAKHRDWIYSHLEDGRVLRDGRWLLEINRGNHKETFYDCGECRDGSAYKDVTDSKDPEVLAARAHFAEILKTMPEPKPREGADGSGKGKGKRKKPQGEDGEE